MLSIPLALLAGFLTAADEKPKLPLGKATTAVLGPLDKDGYIDYQAAYNEIAGKGISPDKNANALLWKAIGPKPNGKEISPATFKALGIEPPPEKGEYFMTYDTFMKEHRKIGKDDVLTVHEQKIKGERRPWSAKDYPHIDAWVNANEKPLAIVLEAVKRPAFFNPASSPINEFGFAVLGGSLDVGMIVRREMASALMLRAMRSLDEKKYDDAWRDIFASHRLGRLIRSNASAVDSLSGRALEEIAMNAELFFLERSQQTGQQLMARWAELQKLPPVEQLDRTIELSERFWFLDNIQLLRRGYTGMFWGSAASYAIKKLEPNEAAVMPELDWEGFLREGNLNFDRMGSCVRAMDYDERVRRLKSFEDDLTRTTGKKFADTVENSFNADSDKAFRTQLAAGKTGAAKAVRERIDNATVGFIMATVTLSQKSFDRREQMMRNLQVAFALESYKRDRNRYPEKLDELVPKYLPTIPNDLYSGKPPFYQVEPDGYLLYSVGVNGKDDGGRKMFDMPSGDDLSVRMPLPEPDP